MKHINSSADILPPSNREVLILVKGVNYIARFDSSKALFRVESELMQTVFRIGEQRISWREYCVERP